MTDADTQHETATGLGAFGTNTDDRYDHHEDVPRHPGGYMITLHLNRDRDSQLNQLLQDIHTYNLYTTSIEYYTLEDTLSVFLSETKPTPENNDKYPHHKGINHAILRDEHTNDGVGITSAFDTKNDGIKLTQSNVRGSATTITEALSIAYAHGYRLHDISCHPNTDLENGALDVVFDGPELGNVPEPVTPDPQTSLKVSVSETYHAETDTTDTRVRIPDAPYAVTESVANWAEETHNIDVTDHNIRIEDNTEN